MKITKEWLKPHSPCSDGYGWFLKKFPQGAEFDEVYAALREEKRYSDSDWLVDKAFKSLTTSEITQEIVKISGADTAKIEAQVQADGANPGANAATTGNYANAATTGKNSIAIALGADTKVMAGEGGVLVLKYWDEKADRPRVKVGYVGEDGIKPEVWYSLDDKFDFSEVVDAC